MSNTTISIITVVILTVIAVFILLNGKGEGQKLSEDQGIPYITIAAHRGLSGLAPEETTPAYLLALEIGADYLEGDVQRTKDGVLVMFHDDDMTRASNIEQVFPDRAHNTIDTFTFAELQQLDLGSWFNKAHPEFARPSFVGLKFLTLKELIDIAESGENRPGLYLETKSALRYPGVEKEIIDLLTQRGWISKTDITLKPGMIYSSLDKDGAAPIRVADGPGKVILQSFEDESVRIMKELAPNVPRVYLVDQELEAEKGGWKALIDIAKSHDADLGPIGYQAWSWRNKEAHKNGVIVHHYTIDKPWQMKLLRYMGTDGIFTNRADIALEVYRGQKMLPIEEYFKKINY
ncbi:MAG: glycerophosphodiester phosphodiesterase [Leptonema sp. (in: Bacteria)]|nr:glycerophosphodiester phosphodiesterase [Leptonema sp. (in: bacteria)]